MKHLITLLTLMTLSGPFSHAQGQASDATIQALLAEVKQLRMALERSAVISPKIQSVLWRMQWQQDVVMRTNSELEGLRSQISQPLPDFESNFRMSEQQIPPEQRKLIEEEMKRNKARFEEEREKMRVREADLSSRLRVEQAKFSELSDRLDAMEKALEGPQTKGQ
jgi:hypothetical protein